MSVLSFDVTAARNSLNEILTLEPPLLEGALYRLLGRECETICILTVTKFRQHQEQRTSEFTLALIVSDGEISDSSNLDLLLS
jgi:hypothetical protein